MTILLLLLLAGPEESRTLKYVFRAGYSATYVQTFSMSQSQRQGTSNELQNDSSIEGQLTFLRKVHRVRADGVADVGHTLTRIRVVAKSGDGREQVLDSANDETPPDLKEYFVALSSSEVMTKIRQNGEVFDVQVPKPLTKALLSKKEGEPGYMAEHKLVRMIKGSMFLLPDTPLVVGTTWKAADATDGDGMHFTYLGPIQQDGRKVLKIAQVAKLKKESDARKTRVLEHWSRGHVLLDPRSCWIIEESLDAVKREASGEGISAIESRLAIGMRNVRKDSAKEPVTPNAGSHP